MAAPAFAGFFWNDSGAGKLQRREISWTPTTNRHDPANKCTKWTPKKRADFLWLCTPTADFRL